jgi:hypothetical protein
MAQVVTRPQRFTPEEWKLASKIKHKNAERDRAAAERLIAESGRLDVETREQSDTTLDDVNKKIGIRKLKKFFENSLRKTFFKLIRLLYQYF